MSEARGLRQVRQARGGWMLALLAAAAVIAAAWAPDAAMAVESKKKAKPEAGQDVLRYLPDGCQVLLSADVAALLRSEAGRKLVGEDESCWFKLSKIDAPKYGLAAEQIARIEGGSFKLSDDEENGVTILRMAKDVSLPPKGSGQEQAAWSRKKIGRQTVFTASGGKSHAVCIPAEHVVLVGKDASRLEEIVRRDRPAQLPEKMAEAWRQLDRTAPVAVTVAASLIWESAEGIVNLPNKLIEPANALNIEIRPDDDLNCRISLVCRDEESAQRFKEVVAGLHFLAETFASANLDPETLAAFRSMKLDRQGCTFTVAMKMPEAVVTVAADEDLAPGGDYAPSSTCVPPASGGGPTSPTNHGFVDPFASPPMVERPASSPSLPCEPPSTGIQSTPSVPYCISSLPVLELPDVVRLVEAGVDEQVIGRYLERHRLGAVLSADDLVLLTKSGASRAVILKIQSMPVVPVDRGKSEPAKDANGRELP